MKKAEASSGPTTTTSSPSSSSSLSTSSLRSRFLMSSNPQLISTLQTPRVQDTIAGSFAGVVGTALGHPLDTVKVRVQTQSKLHPVYSGSVDCFFRIIRNEGMKGLYKGLGSPMLSLTILNSISFGIYGESKRLIHKCFYNSSSSSSTSSRISASNNMELLPSHYSLAGAMVGVICSFISTPFEMIKVRLQLDNITERRYKGSLSCAKELTKLYGGKMLFTGFWINTVRETTFCAVYFGLYEHLKQRFTHLQLNSSPFSASSPPSSSFSSSAKSPLAIFLAGGFAGMAAWFVSFPMDVIKSVIQGQSLSAIANNTVERKRVWKVAVERWRSAGIAGFYSGVIVSVIRAFFVSSSRFAAYEVAVSLISSLDHSSEAGCRDPSVVE